MAEDDTTRAALLRASTPPSRELFSRIIMANHILHQQSVVDAYGHISVRNPQDPTKTFFLSRSCAPALVASREDIQEYYIHDGTPVGPSNEASTEAATTVGQHYAERYIHSEIFKRYPDVRSVVHAHSEATIPFSIGSVPLRPVLHVGGVMGAQVPVYDIAKHYRSSDDLHSLLVTNTHLGAALAAGFNPSSTTTLGKTTALLKTMMTSTEAAAPSFPPSSTVLMRGHGFTCVGTSIEEAVYRAVYTVANARIQTTALLMQGAFNVGLTMDKVGMTAKEAGAVRGESITYLSERETRDAWTALKKSSVQRAWELWCREVQRSGLYDSELDQGVLP